MCISDLLKLKTIEVIKEVSVYPDLKDFDTEEDLLAWFELHKNSFLGEGNFCDDYARECRELALLDGYFMSCALVSEGKCYQTQIFWLDSNNKTTITNTGISDSKNFHIANMAIILKGKSNHQECWFLDISWNICTKLCEFYDGGKF
jgi:hypothetical protein